MFIRIRLIPITIVFVILMLVFRIGSVWNGYETTQTAQAIPNLPTVGLDRNSNNLLSNDSTALVNNDQQYINTSNRIADLGGFISDVRAQDVASEPADTASASPTDTRNIIDFADIPLRNDDSTRGLSPVKLVDDQIIEDSIIDANSLSVAEVRLLHTLADRRRQLENRERSLTERESVLVAAERQLFNQQQELEIIRNDIREDLSIFDELQEKQIIQMRAVYSAMKPKNAAQIFNDLDLDILINVLRGMTARKIAPIIAAMNVEKARNITLSLADRNTYSMPE